eukprot:jgi/Galph1/5939/GphlegSOOS_G4617.1
MSSPRLVVSGSLVNRLLLEVEHSYSRCNHVRIMQDCLEALRQCPSLVARVDALTHNNGMVSKLICLGGTIVIRYKGNGYNIPVDIWIPEPYPNYPPLVYVTPTSDMYIAKNHPHVDSSGLVYLPYLADWKPSACSIAGAVGVLASVFSIKPPVFAKTAQQEQSMTIPRQLPISPTRQSTTSQAEYLTAEEQQRRELVTMASRRMKEQLEEYVNKGRIEINRLLDSRQALQKGSEAIQEGILLPEYSSTMTNTMLAKVSLLKKELEETNRWLQENQHLNTELDIDHLIIFPDNLQRKIVQYRAKDSALQNALCLLDEALEMNVIDLNTFLKVRKLLKDRNMC